MKKSKFSAFCMCIVKRLGVIDLWFWWIKALDKHQFLYLSISHLFLQHGVWHSSIKFDFSEFTNLDWKDFGWRKTWANWKSSRCVPDKWPSGRPKTCLSHSSQTWLNNLNWDSKLGTILSADSRREMHQVFKFRSEPLIHEFDKSW